MKTLGRSNLVSKQQAKPKHTTSICPGPDSCSAALASARSPVARPMAISATHRVSLVRAPSARRPRYHSAETRARYAEGQTIIWREIVEVELSVPTGLKFSHCLENVLFLSQFPINCVFSPRLLLEVQSEPLATGWSDRCPPQRTAAPYISLAPEETPNATARSSVTYAWICRHCNDGRQMGPEMLSLI